MGVLRVALLCVLLTAVCCGDDSPETCEYKHSIPDVSSEGKYGEVSRCTTAGIHCISCSQLSFCAQTITGFDEHIYETCGNGTFCHSSERACSEKKSYCSVDGGFQCQDEGVFPDPFECNRYYSCSATSPDGHLQAYRFTCPGNTAFNIETSLCDLRNDDPICEDYPVPECSSEEGRTAGPLLKNPSIYYVCEEKIPQLFKCSGEGYEFDISLCTCAKDGVPVTTPPPITTSPKPGFPTPNHGSTTAISKNTLLYTSSLYLTVLIINSII